MTMMIIDSRQRQAYFDQLVDTELLCYMGEQWARKKLRNKSWLKWKHKNLSGQSHNLYCITVISVFYNTLISSIVKVLKTAFAISTIFSLGINSFLSSIILINAESDEEKLKSMTKNHSISQFWMITVWELKKVCWWWLSHARGKPIWTNWSTPTFCITLGSSVFANPWATMI